MRWEQNANFWGLSENFFLLARSIRELIFAALVSFWKLSHTLCQINEGFTSHLDGSEGTTNGGNAMQICIFAKGQTGANLYIFLSHVTWFLPADKLISVGSFPGFYQEKWGQHVSPFTPLWNGSEFVISLSPKLVLNSTKKGRNFTSGREKSLGSFFQSRSLRVRYLSVRAKTSLQISSSSFDLWFLVAE